MRKTVFILGLMISCHVQADSDGSRGPNCQYRLIQNNDDNNNPAYTMVVEPVNPSEPAVVEGNTGCNDTDCYVTNAWKNQNVTHIDVKEGVIKVDAHSFEEMSSVVSVTLPEGLKYIGQEAFYADVSLVTINLPSTLETIDRWGICSTSISSIAVPDTVKDLKYLALYSWNLKNVVIGENTTLDENVFHTSPLENIYCGQKNIEQCQNAVAYRGDDVTINRYIKEGGVYILADENFNKTQDYFVSPNDMMNGENACVSLDVCKATVLKNEGYCTDDETCMAIVLTENEHQLIKYNNKSYSSIDDLLKGKSLPKRIYTIEEANAVAKPTGNTVRIKYR